MGELRTYDGMKESEALLAIDGEGKWVEASEAKQRIAELEAQVAILGGPEPTTATGRVVKEHTMRRALDAYAHEKIAELEAERDEAVAVLDEAWHHFNLLSSAYVPGIEGRAIIREGMRLIAQFLNKDGGAGS